MGSESKFAALLPVSLSRTTDTNSAAYDRTRGLFLMTPMVRDAVQSAQPRRLNLGDAIVLVAMTAVGFGLTRPVIAETRHSPTVQNPVPLALLVFV